MTAGADRSDPGPGTSGSDAAGPAGEQLFADRLPLAQRLADQLATAGITRGLIGPRELPRLWSRHLLNCAVLTDLLPPDARIVDVGSGAGLPGLVLACRRPDLRVDLVESLQRRVDFLNETVALLDLESAVRVVHGRAEDATVRSMVGDADWVTARAVAPLDRLVRWCLPLLRPGGTLLAMKGERASMELAEHRSALSRMGAGAMDVVHCGVGAVDEPATVVRIVRTTSVGPDKRGRRHR